MAALGIEAATLVVVVIGAYSFITPESFGVLDAASVVVSILSFAAFAFWNVAAYRLVPPLTGAPADRSPGWAAGGYLVPIANLWIPFQIMSEIRESTDPTSFDHPFGLDDRRGVPLALWWALWLGATMTGTILNAVADGADMQTLEVVSGLFFLTQIGSSIVTLVLVRQMDEGQQEAAAVLTRLRAEADDLGDATGSLAPPPPAAATSLRH